MLACWCLLTRPAFGSQAGNVMQSSRSWVCVLKDFLVSDALPWMPSHTARVRKSGSKIRLDFLSIALLEDVRNYLKSLEGWCRALSFECQAVQMIIHLRVTTTWRRARERPQGRDSILCDWESKLDDQCESTRVCRWCWSADCVMSHV